MKKLITNLLFFIIPIVTFAQNFVDSVMETSTEVNAIFEKLDKFFHLVGEQFNEEYLFCFYSFDSNHSSFGIAIGDFNSNYKVFHINTYGDSILIKPVDLKKIKGKFVVKNREKELIASIPDGLTIFNCPLTKDNWSYVTYVNKKQPINDFGRKSFLQFHGFPDVLGNYFYNRDDPSPLRDLFNSFFALYINTWSADNE